jgi:flavin reductase (DIM6/NTAB) family NADH-FMN oxidoreductase RutF
MGDTRFYEPKDGHRLPHDPFKAIVAPRPIGWISTVDAEGRPNLAPYSFFNAFCDSPPVVGFSSGGRKNSQRNVEETGEFVVNLATRRQADAMNRTSAALPHGVNKFEAAGLRTAPSRLVRPPRVADAPAALECRLLLVLPITDLDGKPTPNTLILGQVVGVHIDPGFLKDGLFDIAAAGTIARCGYRGDYVEVTRVFEMLRPSS